MALMALQAARLPARTDEAGDLILLEDQDRTRWDQQLIAIGFHYFDRSIAGDEVSEYHVQAAIAAAHARGTVDWPMILDLYDQLFAMNASPVVALNRAVAIARVRGAAEALASIESLTCRATTCFSPCAAICCWIWAGCRSRRLLQRGAGVPLLGAGAALPAAEDRGMRDASGRGRG